MLYFAIVEIGAVNPMYQTALAQFIEIFMSSMDVAERASLASKRVANIILTMTDLAYHYINRGLYEDDKLIFKLLVTTKILITAGDLKQSEIALFLRGGAALDINTEKRKPFSWLQNEHWLNILELMCAFAIVTNCMMIGFTSVRCRQAFPLLRDHRWLVIICAEHVLFIG